MILPSFTSTIEALEPFSGTPQKLMSRISVFSPLVPVLLMSSAILLTSAASPAGTTALPQNARLTSTVHDADERDRITGRFHPPMGSVKCRAVPAAGEALP